ncbi:MAG: tripartite tricarboxylate transporter substrate binding protein [Betaproteobacteria bacterium]|nr:tripartite tricarboxylate transporter substrate binding protein [Betaproteobacteria bacterium]
MKTSMRLCLSCAGLALMLAAPSAILAQDFPNRAIRILVPYPSGGQSDIFTRLIAESLKQQFDKPVIVENRPGAGTTLAANLVAKSPPDGYTLLLAAASATAIAPVTMRSVTFDPRQITPVTLIAKVPYILVASKHFAPNTMAEFLAYAKANPGKVNWATHGMGAAQHLTGEMFRRSAGIDITAIHYQGSTPGTLDMIGGRVDIMFDGAGTGLANVRSGQLKAIAMGSDQRVPGAPALPTWKETGVPLSAYTWYGMFAPLGTPAPVMDKLHAAITAAINGKPYKDRMAQAEGEVPSLSIAKAKKFVDEDAVMWANLIRSLNLKLDQ